MANQFFAVVFPLDPVMATILPEKFFATKLEILCRASLLFFTFNIIGEKEKAVDLSQYLLPSLAIHSNLLEPFLKELEKKNELDYWIQQNSSQLKKLDKNTKQSLDALLVKVREKIPT